MDYGCVATQASAYDLKVQQRFDHKLEKTWLDCLPGCLKSQIFYSRLIGPGIVFPQVVRTANPHVYEMRYTPHVPGEYDLEVVLEYSNITEYQSDFYAYASQQAVYEGHSIPRSPFSVVVAPSQSPPPTYSAEKCLSSADAPGSWILKRGTKFTNASWAWKPVHCPVPLEDFVNKKTIMDCLGDRKVHIMLLGDSTTTFMMMNMGRMHIPNLELNHELSPYWIRKTSEEYAQFKDHIVGLIHNYSQGVRWREFSSPSPRVVIFNFGLHAIMELGRHKKDYLHEPMDKVVPRYLDFVGRVLNASQGPAVKHIVFRSSVAAWQKWGNRWIRWHGEQNSFHLNRDSPRYFNTYAHDLVQSYGGKVKWVDCFESSVSRPDDTDYDGHVHYMVDGEVVSTHVRLLLLSIMQNPELGCPAKLPQYIADSTGASLAT
eukprot:Sspe_Gene.118807::Locus_113182_Transcript_1_1_Confidence_1.000_Length_1720::g.118807::m.118807